MAEWYGRNLKHFRSFLSSNQRARESCIAWRSISSLCKNISFNAKHIQITSRIFCQSLMSSFRIVCHADCAHHLPRRPKHPTTQHNKSPHYVFQTQNWSKGLEVKTPGFFKMLQGHTTTSLQTGQDRRRRTSSLLPTDLIAYGHISEEHNKHFDVRAFYEGKRERGYQVKPLCSTMFSWSHVRLNSYGCIPAICIRD